MWKKDWVIGLGEVYLVALGIPRGLKPQGHPPKTVTPFSNRQKHNIMNKLLLLATLLLLAACGSQKKQTAAETGVAERSAEEVYTARGNEPFWRVEISAAWGIVFTPMEGEPTAYPYREPVFSSGMISFVSRTDRSNIRVSFLDRSCSDSMSGETFPYKVSVEKDDEVLKGCGERSSAPENGGS